MNPIEKVVHHVDAFQQGHSATALLFGVVKKFGDDSAGSLAALLAYYGFLSVFPLLLLLITLLGLFFSHDATLQHRVVNSALAQFPIVGKQLAGPHGISSLRAGSVPGLAVGLIGLGWGSMGVTQAGQRAMAEVWNVPGENRPGFMSRLGRSLELLGILAFDVIVSTALAGFVTIGGSMMWTRAVAIVAGLLVNIALFVLGFRVLTPKSVETRSLVTGAVLAALGWSVLQNGGIWLVGHQLRHASQVYGYFASILGLISFLFLAAEITLYSAELNVVRERHLYPRSIVQPPLTDADRDVLEAIVYQGKRRPEQLVQVHFSDRTRGE
ncbi:MAG TPA: YhjD/YihY/BrkB family envelope integrity protein [Acidimicrobiales bacterium]|nr:YhjD/YihY/BrkB family envelope integrity protein [Acidimicrobiales bacterium]HVA09303.1 YhjD/YihY/BrkB family envelope integrity protein [Acidimicrobiales bacterium]